jgi:hypothetical protein
MKSVARVRTLKKLFLSVDADTPRALDQSNGGKSNRGVT